MPKRLEATSLQANLSKYETALVQPWEQELKEFSLPDNPEEIERREEAASSLLAYTEYTFPQYKADPFHEHLAGALTDVVLGAEGGKSQNLMLFAPPQHGKSELVSTRLPSFWLGHNPDLPVALVSYGASLAYRNSRYARSVMDSPFYPRIFPGVQKDDQNWRVEDWHIRNRKGYTMAVGVGGPITGHGFGLGIIDDPIENWAEAQSERNRETIWQWWQGTFRTRLWEGASVIFMMCMPGNTPVLMADGTWRPLDTIRPGESVMTYEDGVMVKKEVEAFLPQGLKRVLKIKTGNHSIKATPNHPFLVERESGEREWVRADEISKGDLIVVLGQMAEGENPRRLTAEDCWALGFMFGDGWIALNPRKDTGAMRWITCVARGEHEELNDRIINYVQEKFDVDMRFVGEARYWRTEVARVGRWFESLGLSGDAHSKRIPDLIFQLPAPLRRSFLEGLIDADGHINPRQRVEFNFTSKEFAQQVKLLAEQSGYQTSNLFRRHGIYNPPGSPEPIEADSYNVQFQRNTVIEDEFETARVRSVKISNSVPVYDLTVADTHNFIAAGCVVHNTRWHEDDLAGRILEEEGTVEEGGKWKVLSYPALCEDPETDPLSREYLEPLAPSRFSKVWLLDFRATVVEQVWQAEYQQNPIPPSGDMFKVGRLDIDDTVPAEICNVVRGVPVNIKDGVRYWDLAGTEKKTAKRDPDSTSGTLIAEHDDRFYVLDNINVQFGPDRVEDLIIQTAKIDGPKVKIVIEQEPGQAGKAQIEHYVKLLAGYEVKGEPSTGDKRTRAAAWASQLNHGNVTLLKSDWNKPFIATHANFPHGVHDDDVDSAAGAFNELTLGEKRWRKTEFASV